MTASAAPAIQDQYDPAGLMASTCLTTYGFSVLHIDNRPEPTTAGRADGIQPRTIEVLRNIGGVSLDDSPGFLASGKGPFSGAGLAKRMISQVLLHQGMIEHAFLDEIEARRRRLPKDKFFAAPSGGVFRPFEFETCSVDESSNKDYPVSSTFTHGVDKTKQHVVRSKYLLGCDGAKSLVRRAIAGGNVGDGEWSGKIRMLGEATEFIWGVMDVVVKTDFPDIMSKCLIHSRDSGSIMVIPRENGLVRLYVQLQQDEKEGGNVKHYGRDATQDICIARAKKIFEPFQLEVGYVDWFSVYQIGQRISSHYMMEDQRIILGGDATHTHSPKAGQGMNISMLDMYSLAWKINLVEKGMADHSVLIPTYETERRGIAEALLKFDTEYSKLFSGASPKADQLTADASKAKSSGAVDAEKFIQVFKQNCLFTSGCGAIYTANILNALPDAELVKSYPKQGVFNPAGSKLVAGQRLLPGMVTRAVDANRVRIQQEVKMNGAFRIHLFAGDYKTNKPKLEAFDKFLASPTSFVNRHRPPKGVSSSIVYVKDSLGRHIENAQPIVERNPFFTFLTVFANPHTQWEIEDLPVTLRSFRDQVYADDNFDVQVASQGKNAALHFKYGVDTTKGSIIVVRPDGYVGAVVQLSEDGFEALNHYFAGFLTGVPAIKASL
ncbi:phenol 2-monooxygenase [Meredithblackwellia eburnea MCA 4105]